MLLVTHDLGLAENLADRTAVMKDGMIIEQGNTDEIFDNPREEYTKKLLGYVAYGKGTSHYHGNYNKKTEALEKEEVPAVTIEHLDKNFPLGRKTIKAILKDFNLTVNRGEIVGLVGPSGSGKSTLARCIMGIYEPDGGRIVTAGGLKMQMIFQDSASAFNPRMKLWEIIAEPADIEARREKRRMGKKELRIMAQEAAEACGIEKELLERYPYDVSGGQRQRAAIARALITKPDLIIADEPISSLDVPVQSQIVHLLKKLRDERNLTMLVISHDIPMVEHISDRIIHI